MNTKKKAQEVCDQIGITDPNERHYFIMGYQHGAIDSTLDVLEQQIDSLRHRPGKSGFPDAETR